MKFNIVEKYLEIKQARKKIGVFVGAVLLAYEDRIPDVEWVIGQLDIHGVFDRKNNHHSREKKRLREEFDFLMKVAKIGKN